MRSRRRGRRPVRVRAGRRPPAGSTRVTRASSGPAGRAGRAPGASAPSVAVTQRAVVAEEPGHGGARRPVEQLARRSVGDEPPSISTAADRRAPTPRRDRGRRRASPARHERTAAPRPRAASRALGVEAGERLVEHQDVGPHGDRPREVHPAALAARQRRRGAFARGARRIAASASRGALRARARGTPHQPSASSMLASTSPREIGRLQRNGDAAGRSICRSPAAARPRARRAACSCRRRWARAAR